MTDKTNSNTSQAPARTGYHAVSGGVFTATGYQSRKSLAAWSREALPADHPGYIPPETRNL
jgi:hypothetical protein